MKISLLLLALLLCGNGTLIAQSRSSITGKIMDGNHAPLEFANVVLLDPSDSAFVQGVISQSDGTFSLPVEPGKRYMLKMSSIGYATAYRDARGGGDVGTVVLTETAGTLGEVVVKGSRPAARIEGNALLVNVESSALAKLGTARDVLAKLPGVMEKDGVLEVFGKGTPQIYINGRQTRDDTELSRLTSDNIKSVEVITNPGARYETSAHAIIRIRTKRVSGEGWGVSLRDENKVSRYYMGSGQLDLTYRTNSLELFATLSADGGKSRDANETSKMNRVDTLWELHSMQREHVRTIDYLGSVGFNYRLDEKHSIGMRYRNNYRLTKRDVTSGSEVRADNTFYDNWENRGDYREEQSPNHELNLYYMGNAGKLGLELNMDYLFSNTRDGQRQYESSRNYDDRVVTTRSLDKSHLYAAKLILSYPLGKGQLSAGGEYTYTNRTNDFRNTEGVLPNSGNTIRENNGAIFAELTHSFGKLDLNVGLRYEHSASIKTYDNLFPSLSLFMPVGTTTWSLSYRMRMDRPSYAQLDGNMYYNDRYDYESGNPLLLPTKRQDATLMFGYRWLTFTASFVHSDDEIVNVSRPYPDDPKISFGSYENHPAFNSFSFFLSCAPTISLWKPQLTLGLVKQWFDMPYHDENKPLNKPIPIVRLYNSFRLPWQSLLRMDAFWQFAGDYQNMRENNLWQMDLSLNKSFLNDQLNLKLDCSDVFKTYKHHLDFYSYHLFESHTNMADTRILRLTISYTFNSSKSKYRGAGAGDAEKGRLGR
ncbi:MAG: outer membrane beta-barrel protein [Mediterranea sp.]|jgi:hypothetical protein|nr:outer membrane beta-barrel protein [Mediterranea sp.]